MQGIYKEKDRSLSFALLGLIVRLWVHSDYSKFLGVPAEVFGMIYYILFFFLFSFSILGSVLPQVYVVFLVLLSVFAFLFSMYLILSADFYIA